MNESDYNGLVERLARSPLAPKELASVREYLAQNPERTVDWELECELDRILRGLPDAPLSSNFTARVLSQVQRTEEKERTERRRHVLSRVVGWLGSPAHAWQMGVAMLMLTVGLVVHHQYRMVNRSLLAHNVAAVSDLTAGKNLQLWQDFRCIYYIAKLPEASPAEDDDLLNALKD